MKTLQIHPTLRCSRNCDWCSYRDQPLPLYDDLPLEVIDQQLKDAKEFGCQAVKISGGGEPLDYESIVTLLLLCKYYHLKVYLQTNGKKLNGIHRKVCDDIRVSYGDGVPFEGDRIGVDGFSYVVSCNPDYENLNRLVSWASSHEQYVKIIQDESADFSQLPGVEDIKAAITIPIETLNITFVDVKNFHPGKNPCPECIENPLLAPDWDGWTYYPCCRTQWALVGKYNQLIEGNRRYDTSFKLGKSLHHIQENPFDGSNCIRCYYE